MHFVPGGSAKVTILSSGNVGIGTTTPIYKLQVHDVTGQSDLAIATDVNVGAGNTTQLSFISDLNGAPAYSSIGQFNTADLRLSATGNLVNPDVFIQAADGNVGIGTTTASRKLEVRGAMAILNNNVIGSGLTYGCPGCGGATTVNLYDGGGNTVFNQTFGTAYYEFQQNGTARMRINTGGNVGIGTTTTGDLLEVSGNVFANAFNSIGSLARYNTTGGTAMWGNGGSSYGAIQSYSDAGGTGRDLAINPNGGNVGVGTTIPAATFDATNGTLNRTIGRFYHSGNLANAGTALTLSNGYSTGTGLVELMGVYTNAFGTSVLSVRDNGTIGIGTTTTTALLDVAGTASLSGNLTFRGAGVANIDLYDNSRLDFRTQQTGAGNHALTTYMSLTNAGNIGINTTAPSSQLQIVGRGSTSATYPLQILNSGGSTSFAVRDDIWASVGTQTRGVSTAHFTVTDGAGSGGDMEGGRYYSYNNTNYYIAPEEGVAAKLGGNIQIPVSSELSFWTGTPFSQKRASISAKLDGAGTGYIIVLDNAGYESGTAGTGETDVCIGNPSYCSGKLDAGTVDPPYTINGKKYATYMPSMTGVKEETTGTVTLAADHKVGASYAYTIDFSKQLDGSDLWLFSKATALKGNINQMSVLLTPSNNARTWYSIDKDSYTLTVYSSRPTTVSYRLSAPRFDYARWPNVSGPNASGGFIINDPDVQPIVSLNKFGNIPEETYAINKVTAQITNNVEKSVYEVRNGNGDLVEETAAFAKVTAAYVEAGAIQAEEVAVRATLTAKNVVAEQLTAISGTITNLTASSFQAINATVQKLTVQDKIISPLVETETIKTGSIKPQNDTLTIDLAKTQPSDKGSFAKLVIKGLDEKPVASFDEAGNATLAGTLTADALIGNRLSAQDATISGSLAATDASISGTLVAKNIQAENITQLENRINGLASASDSANGELFAQVNDIQKQLANLQYQPLPNPAYYQNLTNVTIPSTGSGTVSTTVADASNATLDSLMVVGKANIYKASITDSLTAGNILVQDNEILSLSWDLKLSALSTINMFDGAVVIARNGTLTTRGEIVAQGGVRTNSIQPVTDNADVTVKLNSKTGTNNKLQISNNGAEVASIDASGSARFSSLAFNSVATASAVIADSGLKNKTDQSIPGIVTNAESAGIGTLPAGNAEIVIFNKGITKDSLIYLTPTSEGVSGQLSVTKKESCEPSALVTSPASSCKPYFVVSTGTPNAADVEFNWLIIN